MGFEPEYQPSWFRDCQAMDVCFKTGNNWTNKLFYMQLTKDEENRQLYAVSFKKKNLGSSLKVLCDFSFLRWCCVKGKDPNRLIEASLGMEHLGFHTTFCALKELEDWHSRSEKNVPLVNSAYFDIRNRAEAFCFCDHDQDFQSSEDCLKEFLKKSDSKSYILASKCQRLYEDLRKDENVPVLAVVSGLVVMMQPTKAQKKLFRLARAKEEGDVLLLQKKRKRKEASVYSSSPEDLILKGHSDKVYAFSWSPAGPILASGSGDSTARIWRIAGRTNSLASVIELKHVKAKLDTKSKVVKALDWNFDGTLLATASLDGFVRVWNINGELTNILSHHRGSVLAVKWNKTGKYLCSGSYDDSAIVWDLNTNNLKQQFKFKGSALDVDWQDEHTFAVSSSDTGIYVCKIGEDNPIQVFSGHELRVNHVKWDPMCLLLASCSQDTTVKIWNVQQDKPVCDFKDHAKKVYSICWSPAPDKKVLLASSSLDSTVKLWDVNTGRLSANLDGHMRGAVYCVAFSPCGEYLATGGNDEVQIWSVKENQVIKTYPSTGGSISQVLWNNEGTKFAYSSYNHCLCVSDCKMY